VNRRCFVVVGFYFAIFLVAGCSYIPKATDKNYLKTANWHGRLALRVQAAPDAHLPQAQSFSAAFELQGSMEQGELIFFTPFGSTAAVIQWAPGQAVLQSDGQTQTFENLNQLMAKLLGTDVPVAALFLWLSGQNQEVAGWQVDLSQKAQGKITAQRLTPAPVADLKIQLED